MSFHYGNSISNSIGNSNNIGNSNSNSNRNYSSFAFRELDWSATQRKYSSRADGSFETPGMAPFKPPGIAQMDPFVGFLESNATGFPNSSFFNEQRRQEDLQFIAKLTSSFSGSFSGAAPTLGAVPEQFQTANSVVQVAGDSLQDRDALVGFTTANCPPSLQERCIPPAILPLVTECAGVKIIKAPSADSFGLKSDEQGRDRILQQLEETLRMIPVERKQAYLESLKMCHEKPSVLYFQFLRRTNFNVREAAERLVLYWQRRKELFGERAFLPMTLTGKGALTAEDVLTLKAGYPALLPSSKSGLKVLFFDRSQWIPQATYENKLRCIFYLVQHLADQDGKTQTEGLLVLILGSLPKWRNSDMEYNRLALSLAEDVMPVRFIYHLLNYPAAPLRRYIFQDLLHDVIWFLLDKGISRENMFVHFERVKGELLDALLDLGLTREGIPAVVGGCFLYSQCAKWCRDQSYIETNKTRKRPFLNTNVSTKKVSAVSSDGPKRLSLPKQEEKKRKVRELNLINSRRKRERRRAELQDIMDERDELLGEQESLLVEHARLTSMLDQAKQLLRTVSLKDERCPDE